MVSSDVRSRYEAILGRIERACQTVGRSPDEVTLIAVSKTQSLEQILEAHALGIRDFGESRLQEALPKIKAAPEDIRWHFIGTLQSNKARKIGESFPIVHTISKQSHLQELAKSSTDRPISALVEVNIANEPQKAGLLLQELDEFMPYLLECERVRFCGLMTIGPALDHADAMSPYFRELRQANERVGGQWLSMGMSFDFDVAIQEGATHIRVGSALFGAR